jgi:hypothetical protein
MGGDAQLHSEAFVPLPITIALAIVALVVGAVDLEDQFGLVAVPVGDGLPHHLFEDLHRCRFGGGASSFSSIQATLMEMDLTWEMRADSRRSSIT